jgi:hypothetical protein
MTLFLNTLIGGASATKMVCALILPLAPRVKQPALHIHTYSCYHRNTDTDHSGLRNSPGSHWQPEVASGVNRTYWSRF